MKLFRVKFNLDDYLCVPDNFTESQVKDIACELFAFLQKNKNQLITLKEIITTDDLDHERDLNCIPYDETLNLIAKPGDPTIKEILEENLIIKLAKINKD